MHSGGMKKLLFCILFYVCMTQCRLEETNNQKCQVKQKKDQLESPCIFPFRYKRRISFGCISDDDPENKTWCSTKVDKNMQHIKRSGYWGHCDNKTICHDDRMEITEDKYLEVKELLEDILEYETEQDLFKSVNLKPSISNLQCGCKKKETCEWSSNLSTTLETIPENHFLSFHLRSILRENECGDEKVNCCGEEDDDQFTSNINDDPNETHLGTWKPGPGDCGQKLHSPFVLGGESATIGEFPYMALLAYGKEGDRASRYDCGGSLINKRYVLTAAHCHSSRRPISRVILGEHTLASEIDCETHPNKYCAPEPQVIDVESVTQHDEWSPGAFKKGYDIALVRLKKLAVLAFDNQERSFVVPVCLPWTRDSPGNILKKSDDLIVTGWGKLTNNETLTLENYHKYSAGARTLQKLILKGVSKDQCRNNTLFQNLDTDILLCAGDETGKDSCNGDSGGPLVVRKNNIENEAWYQVGIVSFGTPECGTGLPGIYTRVVKFITWIEENLMD